MKTSQRRNEILERIDLDGEVSVERLLQVYEVSVETIRRDLRVLDERGFVKRVYGGAVKLDQSIRDIPYSDRLTQNLSEKEAIAREAAKLLDDGDSVYIDGKTTCLSLIRHIPQDMELTVVTNSIHVGFQLSSHKVNCSVFLVGGQLDKDGMTTGPKLYQDLKEYRLDKAFFSAIAVNAKGCYYAKPEPQQLAYTLAEVSMNLHLLVDSSKLNRSAFLLGLELNRFDSIVTDAGAPASFLEAAKAASCNVIVAPLHNGTNRMN
ncbi:DeoR/GlpR family DNA-binding transcription regulator [Paenibacillus sp. TRM 82003]|nr:DeoR/GlpR family DNA-binding transcription regulator [Paenibacillus sp. TRM 82003]